MIMELFCSSVYITRQCFSLILSRQRRNYQETAERKRNVKRGRREWLNTWICWPSYLFKKPLTLSSTTQLSDFSLALLLFVVCLFVCLFFRMSLHGMTRNRAHSLLTINRNNTRTVRLQIEHGEGMDRTWQLDISTAQTRHELCDYTEHGEGTGRTLTVRL